MYYFFILSGIVTCCSAWFFMNEQRKFLRKSIRTEGVVVEIITKDIGMLDWVFLPRVAFVTRGGEKREFLSRVSHRDLWSRLFSILKKAEPLHVVGQKVIVRYEPEGTNAIIDMWSERWGLVTILYVLGITMLLGGFVPLVFFWYFFPSR